MRDISGRIQRYRLSRYAVPEGRVRRHLRWIALGLAVWLSAVGVISSHSFIRLWRLSRENARTQRELEGTRRELARLDADLRDPARLKGLGERVLREEDGMAKPGEIIYRIRPAADSSAAN